MKLNACMKHLAAATQSKAVLRLGVWLLSDIHNIAGDLLAGGKAVAVGRRAIEAVRAAVWDSAEGIFAGVRAVIAGRACGLVRDAPVDAPLQDLRNLGLVQQ